LGNLFNGICYSSASVIAMDVDHHSVIRLRVWWGWWLNRRRLLLSEQRVVGCLWMVGGRVRVLALDGLLIN
jgi:hypothetical protein